MRDRAGAGTAVAAVVPMMGRALLVSVAAVVVVLGYLVVANALSTPPEVAPRPPAAQGSPPAWKASYSRQFPGCVASVLWPDRRTPDAVLVRLPGGGVERISREAAAHGALRGSRYEDARIIGACYPE